MASPMKGVLVAGVTLVLVITAVESLNCIQCHSPPDSCLNVIATQCPNDTLSCSSSSVNSSLGGSLVLYQNMNCSTQNCSETNSLVAFAVHVSEEQRFHFSSQCCLGDKCNDTSHDSEGAEVLSNDTVCPACYGNDTASCTPKDRQCYNGEQCIHLIAQFMNGTETKNLTLKGCSNISNSTCHFLSTGNQIVGDVIFHKVECFNASAMPTSQPNTTSSQPKITSSQTNSSPQLTTTLARTTITSNTGIKAPLTALALGSLLLGLLF